jgi:predicted DNA-binding protein
MTQTEDSRKREKHRLMNEQAELIGTLVQKWGNTELYLVRQMIEQELRHRRAGLSNE